MSLVYFTQCHSFCEVWSHMWRSYYGNTSRTDTRHLWGGTPRSCWSPVLSWAAWGTEPWAGGAGGNLKHTHTHSWSGLCVCQRAWVCVRRYTPASAVLWSWRPAGAVDCWEKKKKRVRWTAEHSVCNDQWHCVCVCWGKPLLPFWKNDLSWDTNAVFW